jgi:DNA/RNA endonuclease YhcR with UshA esterase domain
MQENTLLKSAIITIIIGLTFLFFYSQNINLRSVENFDNAFLNEHVKIQGKIESVRITEKATFLKIYGSQTDNFDVILFPEKEVKFIEGDNIEITGKVTEYNGKKEIIADEIVFMSG